MTTALSITNHTRAKIQTAWLAKHLRAVLKLLRIKNCEWSITLVSDKEMTALHAQTMNIPTTTDVLTFDLRDPPPKKSPPSATARANVHAKTNLSLATEGTPIELDTILCLDEATRRAKELSHTPQKELLLYAIHSLLHVQGYDDTTPRKAARMHSREDQILINLGVGPLYARNSP